MRVLGLLVFLSMSSFAALAQVPEMIDFQQPVVPVPQLSTAGILTAVAMIAAHGFVLIRPTLGAP
jgi:hypothetical protein